MAKVFSLSLHNETSLTNRWCHSVFVFKYSIWLHIHEWQVPSGTDGEYWYLFIVNAEEAIHDNQRSQKVIKQRLDPWICLFYHDCVSLERAYEEGFSTYANMLLWSPPKTQQHVARLCVGRMLVGWQVGQRGSGSARTLFTVFITQSHFS